MAGISRFKLNRLAAAVAALFPFASYAPAAMAQNAARIDYATQGVTATGADGRARALQKGDDVRQGETIATGDNSRVYLRFVDGQQMALRPQSQMKIDEYSFAPGQAGGERAVLNMLKGGFRAITGLIGKARREDYQIRTSTATVGIRGTEISGNVDNGFAFTCGSGGCDVRNNETGQTESLAGGETYTCKSASGCVVDEKIAQQNGTQSQNAVMGNTVPGNGSGSGGYTPINDLPSNQPFFSGEKSATDGTFKGLVDDELARRLPPPVAGLAQMVGVNFVPPSPTLYSGAFTTTFTGSTLTALSGVNSENGRIYDLAVTGGASGVLEAQTDGALRIGNWSAFTGTNNGAPYSGNDLHYAVAVPALTTLPTSGSVNYTFGVGNVATTPTASISGYGVTLTSANVIVDFFSSTADIFMRLNYSGEQSGSLTINRYASNAITNSRLSVNNASVSDSNFCCGGGNASLRGVFAGAGASQLGVVYLIQNVTPGTVKGALTLTGTPQVLGGGRSN